MKSGAAGIFVLLVLQAMSLGTAHSAEPDVSQFNEERRKQEEIFRGKDGRITEGYTVDRTLVDYAETFSADFDGKLANLGPKERWMDIGAGRGQAILDYFNPNYDLKRLEGRERRGKKAQAIAISIEDRRTPLWHLTVKSLGENQLQYLFDRRFRDYSLKELGRFQVITDLLGGFSYTEDMSIFMEKALSFLELNGTFYTLLQDVKSEDGSNRPFYPNSPYLTEISDVNGSEVRVCPWLKSITCVEVTCELKPRWKPPIEVYRIHKVCNGVAVPALARTHYEAGTPPERRYRLKN